MPTLQVLFILGALSEDLLALLPLLLQRGLVALMALSTDLAIS